MRKILVVSGFDPCGAGVLADIKTAKSLNTFALAVLTCLTAQNSCRVYDVKPVDTDLFEEKLKAVLEDAKIDAVKIGLISDVKIAKILIEYLKDIKVPKVLDPILNATTGKRIGDLEAYRILLKYVDVITPNLSEAREISEMNGNATDIALEIYRNYGCSVVVTGGEMRGTDVLCYNGEIYEIEAEIFNVEIHGTGCVYSTALACYLAKGLNLIDSCRFARLFIIDNVKKAVKIGRCLPVMNP